MATIVSLVCIGGVMLLGLAAIIWSLRRVQTVSLSGRDLANAAEGNEQIYQEEIRRIAA